MGEETTGPERAGAVVGAPETGVELAGSPSVARMAAGLAAPDTGWETVGDVARIAGASQELVRRYADMGLVKCARDRKGQRLFPSGTGERVRALKAERVARGASTRRA